MSNQATNTAAAAAPAKAKKPSIVDTFLKGCAKGFKVGIENITPAMILGYVLVYILKETGLMDILGTVMSPVMGLFGLPGEAGLHDAPGVYPDGHAHRPLCAYRARNRYQQEVASAAHRRLPA